MWRKFSTDDGLNPDVVLAGCGVEVTMEIIAATRLLQKEGVRVRVVNIVRCVCFNYSCHVWIRLSLTVHLDYAFVFLG